MNSHFENLRASLPERGREAADTRYLNPKSVREYIAALPLANPILVTQQLHDSLCLLNATHLDPLRRLESLELLRSPICATIESLSPQLQSETFPLPEARVHIIATIVAFERELLLGYLSVICDTCQGGRVPFLRGKQVALALTRAMQHQSRRLAIAYLTHARVQPGTWQLLHELFLFAVEAGLADKIGMDTSVGEPRISVRNAYIQALLYAFAKPYHFTQKENLDLGAILPVFASRCRLMPGFAPANTIAVSTQSDCSPPHPLPGQASDTASLWYLDVGDLLESIDGGLHSMSRNGAIEISAKGQGKAQIPATVAERLLRCWRGRQPREFARLPGDMNTEVAVGLQAVHYRLAADMSFDAFVQGVRQSSERNVGNDEARVAIWAYDRVDKEGARVGAQMVDRGRGGYRLRFRQGDKVRARVGELLAVLIDEEHRQIGMMRWLRVEDNGDLEVGVELLGMASHAVMVSGIGTNGVPRPPLRGIFLAPVASAPDENRKLHLLVPQLFGRDTVALEVGWLDQHARETQGHFKTIVDLDIRGAGAEYLIVNVPPQIADRSAAEPPSAEPAVAKMLKFPQRAR